MNSTAEATTAGSSAPSVTSNVPRSWTACRQPGHLVHPGDVLARRRPLADLDREARFECVDDRFQVVERGEPAERGVQRLGDQPLDDPLLGRVIADGLQLDLADGRGDHRTEVRDARGAERLAEADSPLERGRFEDLGVGDRHADADAGTLADLRGAPREMRELGHELLHERRHDHRRAALLDREALLLLADDRHLVRERARVVGPHLRAEAVLERGDDPAAARVVLRVGRRDHEQVERQADDEAADLDVALLEDVEQADLDPFGEVGQLVDRDDPAVRARDQPVVDRQVVRQVAALGDLDRVDLPDEIGDRDVGGRQLLGIAPVARQPVDRRRVTVLLEHRAAGRADRREGIVVELAAAQDGKPRVEKLDELAGHARLRLAALAEEHDVLAGKDGVLEGWDDRILVAHDAGQDRLAGRQPRDQVGAQLFLDRATAPARGAQLREG